MAPDPLCFVLMPFGKKKHPTFGWTLDFDAIYERGIRPGVEHAGMEPIRADGEATGGVIHKAMFERLLLCEYAVADMTLSNANVFYELGFRHAVRRATTLPIYAHTDQPAFDVNMVRAMPYELGEKMSFGDREAELLQTALTERLTELRMVRRDTGAVDSPVFQLIQDFREQDIARLKTDTFRDRALYANDVKKALARAREEGNAAAVQATRGSLPDVADAEAGIVVDLFLTYRALSDHQAMVDLYDEMPAALRRVVLIREQLGFALNRLGRRNEALEVLSDVVSEHGPSSETLGLMGRIFKDQWKEALDAGDEAPARGFLRKAIDTYRRGFESDIRDAYPGVNAVTLLDIAGDTAARDELLPVVRFAVKMRLQGTTPDYWDHATLLELALLADDDATADTALADALANVREPWEPETTASNLRLIRDARVSRDNAEPTSSLIRAIEALT